MLDHWLRYKLRTAVHVCAHAHVCVQGDVFSFGILLWELLTWREPYEDMQAAQVAVLHTLSVQQGKQGEAAQAAAGGGGCGVCGGV